MMPCENQGRRCPVCNDPIRDDVDCARCLGKPGVVDRSKRTDPHAHSIAETMKCFLLSQDEAEDLKDRIISDIELLLPGFLKRTTLNTLLPTIQQRAQVYFVANEVPDCDADELAATLVVKILKATSKKWPHTNVGSWITKIRENLLRDYWRKKRAEERWFGYRADAAAIDEVHETDDPSRRLFVEEFHASEREMVERLLDGDKWQEIKARYGPKAEELRKTLMSMEWDGQSVPLLKKRRRRGPQ